MLRLCYEAIGDKSDEIERFYTEEDWENYTIKVHALKSSARIIGAEELAGEALELEKAGKEGNIAYIREHHAAVVEDYRGYTDRLRPAVERAAADGNGGMT